MIFRRAAGVLAVASSVGAVGIASVFAGSSTDPGAEWHVPEVAAIAYMDASAWAAANEDGCTIDPVLLAGLMHVETWHGQYGGRELLEDGRVSRPVFGPALDGSIPGTMTWPDEDGGVLDADPVWERAVGPGQFMPTTWAATADPGWNPQNIRDAAKATARKLCRDGGGLHDVEGIERAVFSYNPSREYVEDVLAAADVYAGDRTWRSSPAVVDAEQKLVAAAPPTLVSAAEEEERFSEILVRWVDEGGSLARHYWRWMASCYKERRAAADPDDAGCAEPARPRLAPRRGAGGGGKGTGTTIAATTSTTAMSKTVGFGELVAPVDAPMGSRFGMRRHPILGYERMHNGLDYLADCGAPVTTAAAGKVKAAGWDDSGFGNHVEIDHGGGWVTVYAHLSTIGVTVGQQVVVGAPVGAVGTTGLSTGCHLHFELWEGDTAVDPELHLAGDAGKGGKTQSVSTNIEVDGHAA